MEACLLTTLRVFVDGHVFVTCSQKCGAHFDVPFLVFPVDGDVPVQILRHVLGHGFGKSD